LNEHSLKDFDNFMKEGLAPYFVERKEPIKVETIQTIRRLIELFN
jgi:hypothetical protein